MARGGEADEGGEGCTEVGEDGERQFHVTELLGHRAYSGAVVLLPGVGEVLVAEQQDASTVRCLTFFIII